jgi:hypothetical protein
MKEDGSKKEKPLYTIGDYTQASSAFRELLGPSLSPTTGVLARIKPE